MALQGPPPFFLILCLSLLYITRVGWGDRLISPRTVEHDKEHILREGSDRNAERDVVDGPTAFAC